MTQSAQPVSEPVVPPAVSTDDPTVPFAPLPPLKPRPRLLLAASVVFAVWVAILLVMYATTVYPERHPSKPAAEPTRGR